MSYDVDIVCGHCGHAFREFNHTSNQAPMWHWALGESLGDLIERVPDASALVDELTAGVEKLEAEASLARFDSPNGWGSGESGLEFLRSIRDACLEFPSAVVEVSR